MAFPKEAKVGAFVLAGLLVIGVSIFLIGDERRMFVSKENYTSVFDEIEGLNRGAPVRMGGVDVGVVEEVGYSEDANDRAVYVRFSIVTEEARRIREDSVATIAAKGLLGDKMVVISVGSQDKPAIPPGGRIPAKGGQDIDRLIGKLASIGDNAERVVQNLERTTTTLADSALQENIKSGVGSLASILREIDEGDGSLARVLHDPRQGEHLASSLENLDRATRSLVSTTESIERILARVEQGPGLAHELLYGESSALAARQIGGAAEEIQMTLRGIREGKGLARGLLFGDERSDALVADLGGLSRELRGAVVDLRAGKGTLGALLVDPSVYEDIKLLLGNVQRNKALRALVRYSIKQDEETTSVKVPAAGSAASEPR